VSFERFTPGRLSYFPGTVKLCESPGRAGGLPKGTYETPFRLWMNYFGFSFPGENW